MMTGRYIWDYCFFFFIAFKHLYLLMLYTLVTLVFIENLAFLYKYWHTKMYLTLIYMNIILYCTYANTINSKKCYEPIENILYHVYYCCYPISRIFSATHFSIGIKSTDRYRGTYLF